jgi:hypothetical protein
MGRRPRGASPRPRHPGRRRGSEGDPGSSITVAEETVYARRPHSASGAPRAGSRVSPGCHGEAMLRMDAGVARDDGCVGRAWVRSAFILAGRGPPRVCKRNQGAGRVRPFTLVRDWMRPSPPHTGTRAVRRQSPGCIPTPERHQHFRVGGRMDPGIAYVPERQVPARSAQVRQRTSAPLAVGTGGRSVSASRGAGIR